MQPFAYSNGQLCAESVVLATLAEQFGTPCYVYSRAALESQWHAFDKAFGNRDHLICYAVKANSNIAILNLLARLGSGFDIVSAGELQRVLRAGGEASKVVFSGVGKREDEIRFALDVGIHCFNIESPGELERINRVASEMNLVAPVSVRVNPDIDADTHPYIATGLKENKFGIPFDEALSIFEKAAGSQAIEVKGIDCHIGSQITTLAPFTDAMARLLLMIEALTKKGIKLQHIDIGGGLGIQYQDETPPTPSEYISAVLEIFPDKAYQFIVEPGRSVIGNAGMLLTRVEYLKQDTHKSFAIVDAAMNDNLRPALYGAWHDILPLNKTTGKNVTVHDIVGPVCETADCLGRERKLQLAEGDLLAICSVGAYGFSMSSNYNSRPRPPEILIDGDTFYEIRRRETVDDLMAGESILPI